MSRLPPIVRKPRHWLLGPAYYAQRDPLGWIPRWVEEYGDIFTITSPLGRGIASRPPAGRRPSR